MSKAEIAQGAVNAIMGISKGIIADAEISASNQVSQANAYASNLMRAANNELRASRSSLARLTQSINNQRVLENSTGAAEAALINYRRTKDSMANDSLDKQIAFAEQAGAQAAAGALSGLTGGVVDIVKGTTALRKARIEQRIKDAGAGLDYDAAQRNKNLIRAGWDAVDYSEISDDLDKSLDVAVTRIRGGNVLSDIMGGQDSQTLSNLSSSFFKPNRPNKSSVDIGTP
jgi:hypothetical protein